MDKRKDFSGRNILNQKRTNSNSRATCRPFIPSNNEKLSKKKLSLKKRASLSSAKFAFWIFILFQVCLPSFHYLVRVKSPPLKRDLGFSTKICYQFLIFSNFPFFLSPIIIFLKLKFTTISSHSYRTSLYYQSFI